MNALLSLAYSVLAKDLTVVCHAVGFDPFLGYYHQLRFGRSSLALDLMEPFRPLIADSAVLSAINTRMVTPRDFIRAGQSVALRPDGRKAFFRAYEQRMDTLVTHPLFGYRLNYRRMLEIQTRLLARVVTREIESYPVSCRRSGLGSNCRNRNRWGRTTRVECPIDAKSSPTRIPVRTFLSPSFASGEVRKSRGPLACCKPSVIPCLTRSIGRRDRSQPGIAATAASQTRSQLLGNSDVTRTPFPRPHRRGPIEASATGRSYGLGNVAFHGLTAVAPLKRTGPGGV